MLPARHRRAAHGTRTTRQSGNPRDAAGIRALSGASFQPVVALSATFGCAAHAQGPWSPPRTALGAGGHGKNGLVRVFGPIFALAENAHFGGRKTFP